MIEAQSRGDCWSCGQRVASETCAACGSECATPRPRLLGAIGYGAIVGQHLETREGVLAWEGAEDCLVLVRNGGPVRLAKPDVRLVTGASGLEAALSPAGAVCLLAESGVPRWSQTSPEYLRDLAIDTVAADLAGTRLLAIEVLRAGYPHALLDRLPMLTTTERVWLAANNAADHGDWPAMMMQLEFLPRDLYTSRLGLLYRARDYLRLDRSWGALAAAWLRETLATSEIASFLATCLEGQFSHDWVPPDLTHALSEMAAAGAAVPSSRAGQLLDRLSTGGDVAAFGDVSTAARQYAALTSWEPWHAEPRDLAGRSFSFLDELIDRHRISPQTLPDFLPSVPEDHRSYVRARVDPQGLTDEEVQELGLEHERIRRLLLSGEGAQLSRVVGVDPALDALQIKESVLRGSVEALADLQLLVSLDEFDLVRRACDWLASPSVPPPENLAADRTLWPYLAGRLDSSALVQTSGTTYGPGQASFLAWACLNAAKTSLFGWDGGTAGGLAKQVLHFTREEVLTDEALNLVAAVHWSEGRDREAVAAITKALEGAYTTALQVNGVVVAAAASPADSLTILSQLISEAPDLALRMTAARKVVDLLQDEDSEYPETKLQPVYRSLRKVLTQQIPLEDFLLLLEFMSVRDSDWLKSARALSGSPHRSRPEARVVQARAKSLDDMFEVLAKQLRANPDNDWLRGQRDVYLTLMIRRLLTEPDELATAHLGYVMLDNSMPMDDADEVLLTLLCARECAFAIDTDDACLRDERVAEAVSAMQRLRRLDSSDRERIGEACDQCFTAITRHLVAFYGTQVRDNIPSDDLPPTVALAMMARCRFWCGEEIEALTSLRPGVRVAAERRSLDELIGSIRGLLVQLS